MKELLEQLTFSWGLAGVVSNNGINSERIQHLEKSTGYYFPAEFKEYLSQVDGMSPGEADDSLFYFWDHQLIKEELSIAHKSNQNSIYIGFADRIVIESIYMIELTKEPKRTGRVGVKKRDFKIIAPSFEAFLIDYLNNLESKIQQWEETSEEDDDSNLFSLNRLKENLQSYIKTLATSPLIH